MKLINIVSPGNKTTIDDGTDLPTVDQPLKTAKKGHKLKKGKYGMNGVANHSGCGIGGSSGVTGGDAGDGGE